ncbi:MAG: type I-C CRISPR-associated endonuclease Cas1c [Proteobacteria bacterium]|nr:type I-C CRISPR-associated endonuclease Cas1c [Pseudomonadota bacterium]
MKKLLNTLFVTTEGAYLHKERETVVVEVDRKKVLQLPLLSLSNIFCFGRITLTPQFMLACSEKGIGVAYFSEYGRFQARIQGPQTGNVLLRREQYRWADNFEKSSDVARFVIASKLANSRTVLQRTLRNNPQCEGEVDLKISVAELKRTIAKIQNITDLDVLRGKEGEGANSYFKVFHHLIVQQKNDFTFTGRNRRPPRDPVNALLSFIYAIVLQDCVSALEGVGLDPYVGFLHRDRPGRQSLALDLLEEFRAFLGDRLALSMINLQQLKKSDFKFTENGAVLMSDEARKTLLSAYQKRKQETIKHPVLKENIKIGLLFHAQALLLSRHIRGDIDYYPAFLWR